MINYIKNLDNLRHNILVSYLAITVVLILDLITPLGFAVWILYLVPILLIPYRTANKSRIYISAAVISVLLWTGYYLDAPGETSVPIALANRIIMTSILLIVTYVQVQRSNAFKKLSRSEENLQTAQSLAQIGFYEYDLITGEVTWTKEVFNIYEHDVNKGEPSYSELTKYCHPDDFDHVMDIINRAAGNNKPFEVEFRIITPGRKLKYLYNTGISVLDGTGEIVKRVGTIMDITERRKAEEELRRSEERFRVAQEVSPDGFVTFRPKFDENGNLADFIFTFQNEAAGKLNGTKSDEVIGRGLLELFPGQRDTQFFRTYKQVFETGRTMEFEDHYKGETFIGDIWFRVVVVPISEGIALLAQNITERRKAEEALKESQAKLLEAQKLARTGNYSIDFQNNCAMEWSDEMYKIWEVERSAPLPAFEEVWKLVHPEDREALNHILTHKAPGNERVETEFRIVFPGNRIKYVHIITSVSFDESGKLIRREGVEIDITERKLAQLELEKTLRELKRSNKELEQFAYVASHDLQEPIRMISSYMQLLSQRYGDKFDDKAKQFFDFAYDGAKRMSDLIRGLLSYSRVTTQGKEFEPVDLNQVLGDVLKDLQLLIKENKVVITECTLPVVKADDLQMHQLLQNLITNAIKFRNERVPEIKINFKSERKEWHILVEDNGIGIAPEHYERIFMIFQRLHERDKYPGTGLGLAICKKIVERHGGRMWVESEEGKGTIFNFTIMKD